MDDDFRVLMDAARSDRVDQLQIIFHQTQQTSIVPSANQLLLVLHQAVKNRSLSFIRRLFQLSESSDCCRSNLHNSPSHFPHVSSAFSHQSAADSSSHQQRLWPRIPLQSPPHSVSGIGGRFLDVREVASSDTDGAETLQLLLECGGSRHIDDVISPPSLGIGLRPVHLLSRDNHPQLVPLLHSLGVDWNARTTGPYRRVASLPR